MVSTDPPFPPVWWKSAIVYEIYPHSFCDSNGDGVGDLNGIRSKLDHLKELGVDVLWLCPIYCSPMEDMGYDVSNYREINPQYGTMDDWENLVKAVHDRGMKLIMDAVFNHTSNEHPWFKESKSSKVNLKHDWYIWRPPRYIRGIRLPPNNWADSTNAGSAWGYVAERDEYFLHLVSKHQPDLNWKNPDVRAAVADAMKFWLDKGVDGFRLDAINFISKSDDFSCVTVADRTQYYQFVQKKLANGPHVHEYLKELRENVMSDCNGMTVGELGYAFDPPAIEDYILPQNKELDQAFSFELMILDMVLKTPLVVQPFRRREIRRIVNRWQTYGREQGFWNTVFMENHDFGRSITRLANDSPQLRALSAKMLATLLVTQAGTLYVYQGQEIGMKNIPKDWKIEEYKDERTQLYWDMIKKLRQTEQKKENPDMEDILKDIQILARDNARIPVQWDTTENAGFTTGKPWMRVAEADAREGWNVAAQSNDQNSVLSFWKHALKTRKEHEVLIYSSFVGIRTGRKTFTYARKLRDKTAWVAINLSPHDIEVSFEVADDPDINVYTTVLPKLVLNNYANPPGLTGNNIALRAYEAVVYVK